MNELQKAETFLQDTIKMYQQEGWQNLADGTMLELAQCQKNMAQPQKYPSHNVFYFIICTVMLG